MCKHDPQYRIENEQAGGVGCPICNAERKALGAQVAANLKACGASAITPQSFAAWAEVQFADFVDAPEFVPAGKCPVCGLSEHPHSEAECEALLAYEEAGFYDAQAEIAQARIDYRYSSQ